MSQKKQIFKLSILKKLLNDENSCVSLMQSTRLLALPPFYLHDMKSGILSLLNTMLKKYDRSLGGIVMGYQNIKVLMDENTGIIPMGTSETEVNISVEFYIFQPKIGSYLEGVINKKSNNHIGCLVHQYFNATILKPEDVLYEDWICKNFNVDDKIIFKVKDLDFTTLLPLIEGVYDGKNSLEDIQFRPHRNCDIDHAIISDVNKSSQNEKSVSRDLLMSTINTDRKADNDFSDVKEFKNKYKQELNTVNVKLNNDLEESQSLMDLKSFKIKKKKKKKKEEMEFSTDGIFKVNEKKGSNNKDVITDGINIKIQSGESSNKKKKKKRKKKDDNDHEEGLKVVENVEQKENSVEIPYNIFGKLLNVEDVNSNDFAKKNNGKLGINRKKYQNEEPFPNSNKTNECLSSQDIEDNVLYSTQLDPTIGSKKMRISFCSPIPWSTQLTPFEDARSAPQNIEHSIPTHSQGNMVATEKEMKKKQKKRKREKQEESDDLPIAKKIKISDTSPSKEREEARREVNSGTKKSILEIMMEQLFAEQLNKSKRASFMQEKIKKETKKRKMKGERNETGVNGEERKSSEVQSSFSELYIHELERVKEELNKSNQESFKKSKKTKAKLNKQEMVKDMTGEESSKVRLTPHAQVNSTNECGNKSDVKSMIDKLYKQEIDRVKEDLNKSDTDNIKEKRRKSIANDPESLRERTHLLLYDKLLNEAKSAMDLEKYQKLIRNPATEWGKKKKDKEFSDLSTSFSVKKDPKKKSKHKKQKIETCQQTYNRFKNGSMYDAAPTPEKIYPDKSLFSDSEQGQASPIKKSKEVNGDETESGKYQGQNLLDEFFTEEMKRLKGESKRESLKNLEKNEKKWGKTGRKTQFSGEEEQSLYEKLLKQAKSLIDDKEVSLIKSKEKKGKKKKK